MCGYYVCKFITAHIRRTPKDVLRVRIYQFLFIFKWIYIYVLILFLLFQMQDWMVETKGHAKRSSEAVQELIAGLLLEKVLNPNDEFYFDPKE